MAIEWLTLEEIAEELKVPVERVRSWIRRKEDRLIAYRPGGRDYRVKREDLNQFLEDSKTGDDDTEE